MMIMNYDNVANRWEKRSLGLGREERTAMQASDLLVSFAKSSQSSSSKFNSKSSSSLSKSKSSFIILKIRITQIKSINNAVGPPRKRPPSVRVPHPLEAIFVLIVIVK